jgi:hypothetical protein
MTLRHLWTSTGEPHTWEFSGPDEIELRKLLPQLGEFKADMSKRSGVLIADTNEGVVGVWNRAGAARLQSLIDATAHEAHWLEFRHALQDAVTGP